MNGKTQRTEAETGSKMTEKLQRAQTDLKEAIERETETRNRMREFAHDILTPLTAMLGYSEVFKKQTFGPIENEKYREYASIIHESSLQLVALCDLVVRQQVAQGGGGDEVNLVVVNAEEAFRSVIVTFEEQARSRGIALKSEVSGDFPQLVLPPQHLDRILNNLVSNALKFTPKSGTVTIKAHLDAKNDAVMLVVRDTGIGIPADEIMMVLRPDFSRSSLAGYSGTGIGLSIVQRLVTEIGGTMGIKSHIDHGTTISIRFPRAVMR